MAKTKDIQRRIKSINNIKKITKAMEMVAASKMRKAVDAVLKTRTYANLSWETVLRLADLSARNNEPLHPLLAKRITVKKICIVLITSNRGLCGGFNTAIINKVKESIKKHNHSKDTEFIIIGKKGTIMHKLGYNIVAEMPKADIAHEIQEIRGVSQLVIRDFQKQVYDKVFVAYTDFTSPIQQVARVKQLLPVDINADDEYLGVVGKSDTLKTTKEFIKSKQNIHTQNNECLFEPSPNEVLDSLVPKLIEVQLHQALLESNASEHSARMTAMHQANDAAKDIVDELTLSFNKARQASITAEIAEISAGANALAD
jgi:F-type H+-transporting ATPase subunit gamma